MAAKRSYEKTVSPCGNCGKQVSRPKSDKSKRVFCSLKCYHSSSYHSSNVSARMASNRPRLELRCARCGDPFTRPPSRVKEGRNYCSRVCKNADHVVAGQLTTGGYVKVFVGVGTPGATKTGHIMQHRLVMQEVLGRPLLPEENIHHRNGDRADNRLENLELWNTSQPSGQHVADKIAWAKSLLALYEGIPTELSNGREQVEAGSQEGRSG